MFDRRIFVFPFFKKFFYNRFQLIIGYRCAVTLNAFLVHQLWLFVFFFFFFRKRFSFYFVKNSPTCNIQLQIFSSCKYRCTFIAIIDPTLTNQLIFPTHHLLFFLFSFRKLLIASTRYTCALHLRVYRCISLTFCQKKKNRSTFRNIVSFRRKREQQNE